MDFYYQFSPAGILLAPLVEGEELRYEPFRGPGHYGLCQELAESGAARCLAHSDGVLRSFEVRRHVGGGSFIASLASCSSLIGPREIDQEIEIANALSYLSDQAGLATLPATVPERVSDSWLAVQRARNLQALELLVAVVTPEASIGTLDALLRVATKLGAVATCTVVERIRRVAIAKIGWAG